MTTAAVGAHLALGLGEPFLQALPARAGVGELGDAGPRVTRELEERDEGIVVRGRGQVGGVRPQQVGQRGPALVDGVEPGRVDLEAGGVRARLGHDVVGDVHDVAEPLGPLLQLRVVRGCHVQGVAGRLQRRDGAAALLLVAVERGAGGRDGLQQ